MGAAEAVRPATCDLTSQTGSLSLERVEPLPMIDEAFDPAHPNRQPERYRNVVSQVGSARPSAI